MTISFIGCNNSSISDRGYQQIGMDEAIEMMKEEQDYIILDVRTPEEYAEKHIPNAINVPNETIGEDVIPELPDESNLLRSEPNCSIFSNIFLAIMAFSLVEKTSKPVY